MLNAICYFFSFLVEAVILWQYSSTLFIPKQNTGIRFLVLCSLYSVLFSASLLEIKWLNTSLYFFLNFIFFITQYNIKFFLATFHSTILTSLMGMCELVVYSIIKYFAPSFLIDKTSFLELMIFAIFNKLIFFTITCFISYFFKEKQKCNRQHDHSIFLLIFIPITSIFVMFTFMNIGEYMPLPPFLSWMIFFSSILLLTNNLLIFGINQYNQKKNIEFTEMQLLLQKETTVVEYYEMLRIQNENQRILIHDIKRHLQSIDILNHNNESEKIRLYIKNLLLSSSLKEYSKHCEHSLLNSILCQYMQKCTSKSISLHIDIRKDSIDFISDNDLTSLFCNLLDNAVEAASHISDSYIELNTVRREKTPFIVITLINSCPKNPFSNAAGSLTTSKSDKNIHGFGIKSIRKIIHKYYGNMQMYYNDNTLTFHTIITLKKSNL